MWHVTLFEKKKNVFIIVKICLYVRNSHAHSLTCSPETHVPSLRYGQISENTPHSCCGEQWWCDIVLNKAMAQRRIMTSFPLISLISVSTGWTNTSTLSKLNKGELWIWVWVGWKLHWNLVSLVETCKCTQQWCHGVLTRPGVHLNITAARRELLLLWNYSKCPCIH